VENLMEGNGVSVKDPNAEVITKQDFSRIAAGCNIWYLSNFDLFPKNVHHKIYVWRKDLLCPHQTNVTASIQN
tara:strand:- start:52 stop:270 length:219 start_codon:yes stop_codon:yes gene_type:complete